MGMFDDMMEETAASGTVPGVTLGLVKENWDKDHPGRIKVELVLGEEKLNVTGWLPVMTPYGGNGYGLYTLPEIGSRVVVAFHMGDWDCPIVLGSLWNQKDKPPEGMAAEKNINKCFITKGGHQMIFNEEENKQSLCIRTPGKLTVTLEDEAQTITIQDEKGENGLVIKGESGEVCVNAKKKLSFSVDGKAMISLDGEGEKVELNGNQITAEAKQTLELKGQEVKMSGTSLEVKGESSMKAESGGLLQLKGSMVKIN